MSFLLNAEIQDRKLRGRIGLMVDCAGYIPLLNVGVAFGRIFYVIGVKCQRYIVEKATRNALRQLAADFGGQAEKKKLFMDIRAHIVSLGSISTFGMTEEGLLSYTCACKREFEIIQSMKEVHTRSSRVNTNLKTAAWEVIPLVKAVRDLFIFIRS